MVSVDVPAKRMSYNYLVSNAVALIGRLWPSDNIRPVTAPPSKQSVECKLESRCVEQR
jgi:hypothetical protein